MLEASPVIEPPVHTQAGRQRRAAAFTTPAVRGVLWLLGIVVCGAILYPLGTMAKYLFFVDGHLTVEPFQDALRMPGLGQAAINTVVVVVASGTSALIVATALAWCAERSDASLGAIGGIVPLVPFFMPSIAGAIGWVFLLSPSSGTLNVALRALFGLEAPGPLDINTIWGMIWVTTIFLVPYAYLSIAATLREVNPDLEAASRTCGCGVLRTFLQVTVPSIRPVLVSASVLLVMMGLAFLSVAIVIGTPARVDVISVLIYRAMLSGSETEFPQGVVLSFLLVAVILLVLCVQWFLTRGRQFQRIASHAVQMRRIRLGRWKWIARLATVLYIVIAVILPLLALVVVSLETFWSSTIQWHTFSLASYGQLLDSPFVADSLLNSIVLAAGAAVIGISVAFALAWNSHVRGSRKSSRAIMGVTALPAGIPHLVFGVGFLLAFSQKPFVLYGSASLLLLAYITIWLPQAMQFAHSGVRQVGRDMVEASQIAGASELRAMTRIGLPVALPQMAGGFMILFVLAMSEFNVSVMLTTPTNNTAGPTLLSLWDNGNYPLVAALAVVICVINAVITLTALAIARFVRRDQ